VKDMRIGTVELETPVIAAPMAGVSNAPYRLLAREAGAGLVCSEMISAKGLVYSPDRTRPLLDYDPAEKPISFQIFGSEPAFMARAAQYIEGLGADIIDINMGCPVSKVVRGGEGCALMQNPSLAGDIITAVKSVVAVPVTVKIRKGWDDARVNAVEMAVLAAEKGAAAVMVHGRTREQFYGGKADWQIIREVVQAIDIPVIGSGDIFSPQDALNMLRQTGCAGVMVARGALGNPWIFSGIAALLEGKEPRDPPPQEKIQMALRHMDLLVAFKGEKVGIREMRKHASWYSKGLRGSALARQEICKAENREQLTEALLPMSNPILP
jgi:tRNA-dihydrouridine synthase B